MTKVPVETIIYTGKVAGSKHSSITIPCPVIPVVRSHAVTYLGGFMLLMPIRLDRIGSFNFFFR